jgi:TM2 domain-containing membrane protein YozV
MRGAIAAFIVLALFLVPLLALAQPEGVLQRKDPILAGALSWYVPGLGQMYGGAIFKGAAFMVVEYGLIYSFLITVAQVDVGVSGGFTLGFKLSTKEGGLTSSEQTTAILLGTSLVVIHFINIIDAVNTSREHNEELEKKLRTDIQFEPDQHAYRFGLSGHF